jgi:hypothetical protein
MNTNRIRNDDLPRQQDEPQTQGECTDSRWEIYRKALISFLVMIVVGAFVGTVVSLLIH